MKKILFILEGDYNHPSSRIRVLQYIPFFKKTNSFKISFHKRVIDIKLNFFGKLLFFIYKRLAKLCRPFRLMFFKYDIVFIQRMFLSELEFSILKRKKTKIIFDFDDAIFLGKNLPKFLVNIYNSDHIIVSTGSLKDYLIKYISYPFVPVSINKNISVVYNSIVKKNINNKINNKNNKIIIGWTGSKSALNYLNIIIDDIVKILNKFENVEFWYIASDDKFSNLHPNIKFFKWEENTEINFLSQFDLALIPSDISEWAKYKSNYKLFLYLMYDIPVVGTGFGINNIIIKDGINGKKTKDNLNWEETISNIILNNEIDKFKHNIIKSDKSNSNILNNFKKIINIITK